MNDIRPYEARVRRVLKGAGRWHPSLSLPAQGLSAAMLQLDRAMEAILALDEITYVEKTAYGEKIVPHPVFAMAEKAQATILRYCKLLGVVPEEIVTEERDDRLTELTKTLIGTGGGGGDIIRPQ